MTSYFGSSRRLRFARWKGRASFESCVTCRAVLISTRIIIHPLLPSDTKPNAFRVHPVSYAKDTGSTAAVTLTWQLTPV